MRVTSHYASDSFLRTLHGMCSLFLHINHSAGEGKQ